MVKDEQKTIKRAIESAIKLVDGIVLVDTGSSDATIDIATAVAADYNVPIAVHEERWVDFGTNRTSALAYARSLYESDLQNTLFLLLDADDQIADFPDRRDISSTAEAFTAVNKFGNSCYYQIRMLRGSVEFYWLGKTHECLSSNRGADLKLEHLNGFLYVLGTDSNRRLSGRKTIEDIAMLKETLVENPNDARAWFYLGNCYADLGDYYKAVVAYQHRIPLDGYDEEVYVSQFRAGVCCELLGKYDDAVLSWLSAIEIDPARKEAYTKLAEFFYSAKKHKLAKIFAELGIATNPVEGQLFADSSCQDRCWYVFERTHKASKQETKPATEA